MGDMALMLASVYASYAHNSIEVCLQNLFNDLMIKVSTFSDKKRKHC